MANPRYRTLPITFERGLIETVEDSMLPPGACAQCQNWAPDPSGNLRARRGWLLGSTTSAPAAGSRKGIGIGYYSRGLLPGVVQKSDPMTSISASTVVPVWPRATTAGNLLVLVVSTQAAFPNIATPAGWTSALEVGSTECGHAGIFYKENAAAESGSVTVNVSSGSQNVAQLWEISGIALSSALDKTGSDADTGADTTAASGTTAATTQSIEFVISIISSRLLTTHTEVTNSFTLDATTQVDGTNDNTTSVLFKVVTSTGAQSTAVTQSSATSVGAIATFKGWYSSTPAAGQTNSRSFLVANDETTSINIYKLDADNLSAGTWSSAETVSVVPSVFPVSFAPGFDRVFYTHPNFSTLRSWNGSAALSITGAPAGRCVATHKSRVFVGGSEGAPTKLYYSEVHDPAAWSGGTAGYIEVGEGDGEAIEDIAPFEDGLLIGKRTSLWYLTGAGPDNFRLIRLPSQTGIAPGRTITPTPYGAVLAGRKALMIYSGGAVTTYSGALPDSYGLTGNWMSGAVINDMYYCLDAASGTTWVLDLTEGVWHTEVVGTGNEIPYVIYGQDANLLFTPKAATTGSLLQYRLEPASTRQKDFSTIDEAFVAWTPDIWPVGPEDKVTPRHLFLKVRQRADGPYSTGITVTPVYDGRTQTPRTLAADDTAGVYWKHLSIGEERGVSSFQFKLTQTATTGDSVFDIEELTVGFEVNTRAGR